MKLKYIEELNNLVEKFIKYFGCKAEIDTDFAYYPEEKVVTWSPFIMDKADRYFNEFVNEFFPNIEADIFLWSLLHEVGHHMTYEFWSAENLEQSKKVKDLAAERLERKGINPKAEKLCYFMYFSADDEMRATGWAAEYMETHPERVAKFWHDFVDAYNTFLSLNKIEKNFSEKI